jgi:hypothetical protein
VLDGARKMARGAASEVVTGTVRTLIGLLVIPVIAYYLRQSSTRSSASS